MNAHCHLELSALADVVPGGGGFIAWAQRFLKKVGETARDDRRLAAGKAAADAARFGTAAIGDVGNSLDAAPAIGAAASPACCSMSCSARAKRRPATRSPTPPVSARRATPAGPPTSATCARRTPPTP